MTYVPSVGRFSQDAAIDGRLAATPNNRPSFNMKPILSLLSCLLSLAASAHAAIEPGLYLGPDGTSFVSLKLKGDTLVYHDGRWDSEYVKVSENKYQLKGYSTLLTLDEGGKVVLTDAAGSFKNALALWAPAMAKTAEGVIAFDSYDNRHYAAKSTDARFVGLYKTESRGAFGAPIVELNADGRGVFQPHGVAPIPVEWWMETTPAGALQTIKGARGDRHFVVVRYGPGGGGNYPEGRYDRMQLDVWPDKTVIMGERVKQR